MHPHEDEKYKESLLIHFATDYSQNKIRCNGDQLDQEYDKYKNKKPWVTIGLMAAVGGPMYYYDKYVARTHKSESFFRSSKGIFVPFVVCALFMGITAEVVTPMKELAARMSLKYEPQVVQMHSDLKEYYERHNLEVPKEELVDWEAKGFEEKKF